MSNLCVFTRNTTKKHKTNPRTMQTKKIITVVVCFPASAKKRKNTKNQPLTDIQYHENIF